MIAEIRSEICDGYRERLIMDPPSVMFWMKKEEKMVPNGFRPPRKVAAMPLKPMPGTEVWVTDHCMYPDRNMNAAPMPARPPPMVSLKIPAVSYNCFVIFLLNRTTSTFKRRIIRSELL